MALLVLDGLVLLSYKRAGGLYGGTARYYGKKLTWHVVGGFLCVASGALAIFLFPCRLLSGHKGPLMVGYTCASLIWSYAAIRMLLAPLSLDALFDLFVFSHTFTFVRASFWLHYAVGLPTETKNDGAYSKSTLTGFLATMLIAWGLPGVVGFLLVFATSYTLGSLPRVARRHVLNSGGSGSSISDGGGGDCVRFR
eukprot:jgi/Mesen1/6479/ME000331S05599